LGAGGGEEPHSKSVSSGGQPKVGQKKKPLGYFKKIVPCGKKGWLDHPKKTKQQRMRKKKKEEIPPKDSETK